MILSHEFAVFLATLRQIIFSLLATNICYARELNCVFSTHTNLCVSWRLSRARIYINVAGVMKLRNFFSKYPWNIYKVNWKRCKLGVKVVIHSVAQAKRLPPPRKAWLMQEWTKGKQETSTVYVHFHSSRAESEARWGCTFIYFSWEFG